MNKYKREGSTVSADHWIFSEEETPLVTPVMFDYLHPQGNAAKMSQLSLRKVSLPQIKGAKGAKQPPRILTSRPTDEHSTPRKINFNALIENARKKATNKKKTKKKVRLRLPSEDDTPAETPNQQILNPFENNWLVDTPRDILREKTMVDLKSPLQAELQAYHDEVAMVEVEDYQMAGKMARELVRYLTRKFSKMEFSNGLKLLPLILAGSTFDDSQSMELSEIDILLCFDLPAKSKIETLQPGYQIIGLPRLKDKDGITDPDDPWAFGRSEDGQYLSCKTVSWLLYSIVEKVIASRPNTVLHPYMVQEGCSQIILTINERFNVHLIPAAWDARLEAHLVTRPYLYDENPFSDMMWRYCFTQDERMLFRTMEGADRGNRLKVYRVLKALIRVEHTLEGLTGYQIKTVLLHMFDSDVDNTPRWQRGDMESCFLNVLKELKHYLVKRNLPNFFVKGQNLLDNMPDRTWSNLKNRVSYLVSNPRECVRILKKRSRLQLNQLTGRAMISSVTSTQTV